MLESHQMVEKNIGLAKNIANKYCFTTGLEFDDLFQIASMGLFKAAKGFKPEKGWTFGTFAWSVMKNDLTSFAKRGIKYSTEARIDGDESFIQIASDDNVSETVENSVMIEQIKQMITKEEFDLLWQRHVVGRSQKELALEIGTSQGQVCRIEREIKERLREAM